MSAHCNDSLTSPASEDCAAPICNLETSGNKCVAASANQGESCDIKVSKDEGNTCYIGNECSGINCIAAYKAENYLCAGPIEDAFDSECVEYKCKKDANPEAEDSTRTTCKAVLKSNETECNRGEGFPRGKYSRLHTQSFHTLFRHMPYLILHYFIHFITQANATGETSAMERECVPRHIHTSLVTPLVVTV